jgi:hypothetical protein
MTTLEGHPAGHRAATAWLLIVVAAAACLLFSGLGAYSLWDDEAAQTITAEQVWRTGDTSVVAGHNLVAYDGGAELQGLRDRATPPLPSYLMAPFVGSNTISALRPRLPFALCGLAFAVLFTAWALRAGSDSTTRILLGMGLLGNVPFLLYCRQARYYAIVLLCSLAIGWIYLRWNGSRRALVGLSALMFCLLASHTMSFAAVAVVLLVDYLVWQRRVRPLGAGGWALVLGPQLVLGLAMLAVWNPLATTRGSDLFSNTLSQRLEIFWWNLRDLDRAELGVGAVLLGAPVVWLVRGRNPILIRGPVAILVYCLVVAFVTPKVFARSPRTADVRYLLPLLPLCIAIAAVALRAATGPRRCLALAMGAVAFGTNLLCGGPALPHGLRSTIAQFVGELRHPVPGPYSATVEWINGHVTAGQTIWVLPGYAAYPLMYHAPQAIYAWQLRYPPEPQFAGLGAIHFFGIEPPDYMISFGPYIGGTLQVIQSGRKLGFYYKRIALIDEYWVTEHRPSLISHEFQDKTGYDRRYEAIYVFRHVTADPGPQRIDDVEARTTSSEATAGPRSSSGG